MPARTHGATTTVEYVTWKAMIQRCTNPNHISYPWYGAKGITVCSRWRRRFESFLKDMGPRPSDKHSIERLNSRRPYSKNNCIWATVLHQRRNQTSNLKIRIRGNLMCLREACERYSINSYHTVWSRLRSGWSVMDALWIPSKGKRPGAKP